MFRLHALTVVVPLLLPSISLAGSAALDWSNPTQNTDGSPFTDFVSTEIHYGCNGSGNYTDVLIVPAPANSAQITSLPDAGVCYFAARTVNSAGIRSAFSTEASKNFGTLALPGPVEALNVTWQESPPAPAGLFDDFNRPTLGASWSQVVSSVIIEADQVRGDVASFTRREAYHVLSYGTDQYAEIDIAAITGTGQTSAIGVYVRMDGTGSGYRALVSPDTSGPAYGTKVQRIDGGSITEFTDFDHPWQPGDVLRLEARGAALTVLKNGAPIFTLTDSTYADGYTGIVAAGGRIRGDNWRSGAL